MCDRVRRPERAANGRRVRSLARLACVCRDRDAGRVVCEAQSAPGRLCGARPDLGSPAAA